ncbi:hypothetical protein ACEZDB_06040 [Streptacidiphilus sp. N1-3]|uniref:Glutamate/phenylalanine/leucine/valine/L-tryptophan dehydrogenase C-terminal domain-containing protein n=1 Tax=Streptacidiphilus alkalitolerans TaxID=3342712 RepID=A0ABV6WW02_9ACTN
MTGRAVTGGAGGAVRVRRYAGPRGSSLHVALATGSPEQPLPANGGLRVRAHGPDVPHAWPLSRRLATEMLLKHRLHHTGFWGAKMVVTGAEAVDDELLALVASVLDSHTGALYTGADMGVTADQMERLSRMTPYVLNAVGSSVEPNSATAHGVLGAIEAWARGAVAGLRVLVHGTGKVGGVLAGALAAAGAIVLTCDTAPGAADLPGCRAVLDWAAEEVDLLVPCSVSDLIDPSLARRLRCGAVIGSANAVLADEAVIVDSIEHYAPRAFHEASPERVYTFVRETVRASATELLRSAVGLSPTAALRRMPLRGPEPDSFCGLRFAAAATRPDQSSVGP